MINKKNESENDAELARTYGLKQKDNSKKNFQAIVQLGKTDNEYKKITISEMDRERDDKLRKDKF